ncbi:recombination protein NinB [Methylobacterium sp. E-005]|uniref:recombination protein NinB n=1 Tax=Methylobacterium sp. E-005 TaxID=2836549 RepID=UPI001FBC12C7|nr:recombination protein NinB [Methylobacterium sp. E-005]MCJ2085015.1 recombination protein NinB [Methylobacterium sp. E-005]
MSKATLILANAAVRDRALRWVATAPAGTRIEFREPQRSLDQNSKLWAMLTDVARQHEHYGQRYEPDAWKILFLTALGKELRLAPALDGKGVVSLGTSSSKLSKSEMSDLLEFIAAWGAENRIVWSDPTLAQDAASMGRVAA